MNVILAYSCLVTCVQAMEMKNDLALANIAWFRIEYLMIGLKTASVLRY